MTALNTFAIVTVISKNAHYPLIALTLFKTEVGVTENKILSASFLVVQEFFSSSGHYPVKAYYSKSKSRIGTYMRFRLRVVSLGQASNNWSSAVIR